jgi:putative ABC transport system permease protein
MGVGRFFRRAASDRDRLDELESYLEIETDENIARGMPADAARNAARRKLGNRTLIREEIYRMNTITLLDSVGRDLRYGLRTLRRSPSFAAIVLLTLAIGIGANTAIFSVLNGILIKPLPYPNAEELVGVWHVAPGLNIPGRVNVSPTMFFTYREASRTFQDFGLWSTGGTSVTGLAEPEQVRTLFVTHGVLQALNVPPALGRWFSQGDDEPGTPETVLLTHGYWQRRFGGDATVIGRTLMVESRLREVIGVMPERFRFLNADPELIVPLRFDRSRVFLGNFSFLGLARLKPGVTMAQANADIGRMLPIWLEAWPPPPGVDRRFFANWKTGPALQPLKQDVVGNVGNVLWVLMGTIGIVLLIACANVANLLLVRAEGRQPELAIRAALGAGWGRIVRELLIESALLGLIGGTLGVGLAYAGLRLLRAIEPANLPRLGEISIDPLVLGFALVVSLLSGLLFGLIPALKYAGPQRAMALRAGGRTSSHGRERHRARNTLVVVQVALALVLLVASGLMIRTFQALLGIEPGFTRAAELQTVRISIPESLVPQPERVTRMQNDIVEKLAAIPGVTSAGFASSVPMEGVNWNDPVFAEDTTYPAGQTPPFRRFKFVSPEFRQTAGTRLVAGRDLTWTEIYDRRPVVMVSENLAREMWGRPDSALGKRIRQASNAPWREVVGVLEDVRDNGVHESAPTMVYWPAMMENFRSTSLNVTRSAAFVIRGDRAGSESFLSQVREAVWSVNANLPLARVRTMQDIYDQSLARTSFTLVMLAIAGAMAFGLGIIGIYGVMSYAVSQRTREIGIRLALGAQQGELKKMVVRHGLAVAGIGVVIGLGAAAGLTRVMSSLLFGISPLDPMTFVAVPLLLMIAAMLASYLPARRAAAVDPVEALKAE